MTPEDALNIADQALIAYHGKSLTDIQRMILQESYNGKGYEAMGPYSPQHIKNEGKDLWKLLSSALREKVSKTSFKGALEKLFKQSQFKPNPPDTNIYNPQTWVGRESLINNLLTKFDLNTRIVWLTGVSGIGKTRLGKCLAVKAYENNPSFNWLYFEILESQLPNFATGARELLGILGEKNLDPKEMNDPKRLCDRLINKLQSNVYWLQIDAVEKLIESNEFIDSYWLTFLQRCLTSPNFSSRWLLTSQVLPNSMIGWQYNANYTNLWHHETLKGLSGNPPLTTHSKGGEYSEQIQFFAKNGITVTKLNQDILSYIGQTYEGHPFVLQVITEDIIQDYQGNVGEYWQNNKAEFEQVSRELNTKRLEQTEYNDTLDRLIRKKVKKSLEKLPSEAVAMLCRSAVYRRPVPKSFWLGMMTEYTVQQQKLTYEILSNYVLIENEKGLIRQHNLIRDIAYNWLQEDPNHLKVAEYKAAEIWLNKYKIENNMENIEKIRAYLEGFYHYCNSGDWEKARELFMNKLGEKQLRLYKLLHLWGYYEEKINLCQRILGKSTEDIDLICLMAIGNGYLGLNNYLKSFEYHNKSLEIAEKNNDLKVKGQALNNLGNVYSIQGKYQESKKYYQKRLDIAREINDRKGECSALNNLGNTFITLGDDYTQAIKYCEDSFNIATEIKNFQMQVKSSANLGIAYNKLHKYQEAIKWNELALNIATNKENPKGQLIALVNLGIIYNDSGNYTKAMDYHQQALEFVDKIGNGRTKGYILNNMGETKINLNKYDEALENLQEALDVFQKIETPARKAKVVKNLAELYHKTKQPQLAKKHCEEALQIATDLGIPLLKECEDLLLKIEEGNK